MVSPPIVDVVGVASCPSAVSMARKSRDHDHGFNWLLDLGCWLLALGIVPVRVRVFLTLLWTWTRLRLLLSRWDPRPSTFASPQRLFSF